MQVPKRNGVAVKPRQVSDGAMEGTDLRVNWKVEYMGSGGTIWMGDNGEDRTVTDDSQSSDLDSWMSVSAITSDTTCLKANLV